MHLSRPFFRRQAALLSGRVRTSGWLLCVGVVACAGGSGTGSGAEQASPSAPVSPEPTRSEASKSGAAGSGGRAAISPAGPAGVPTQPAAQVTVTGLGVAGASAGVAGVMAGSVGAVTAPSAAAVAGASGRAGPAAGAAAAAGSGGAPAAGAPVHAGSGGAAGATAPVADMDHYQMRGHYEVERLDNQGAGTLVGATDAQYPQSPAQDPSAFTVYLPKNAGEGEHFPLITWGNGTYVNPTYYDELITHIVSHGFVVVGANDSQVGSGAAMLKAVEWATAQNADSKSRLFGLIDTEHVGATGQSQGGSGTCNAGLDPRIDAIAPLSGVPLDGGNNFVMNLKAPVFFVNSAGEDASSSMVKDIYQRVSAPAVYGVTKTGEHSSYGDIADDPMALIGGPADDGRESRAGVTAWFEWQLKGKAELRALFVGPSCGFCTGSTWKTLLSKGF